MTVCHYWRTRAGLGPGVSRHTRGGYIYTLLPSPEARSVQENCDLEEVNLAWNGFHLRGCIALGEALAHNNSLTLLDITCNRVSEVALAQLLKGLKQNTTLEKLVVSVAHSLLVPCLSGRGH